MSDLRRSQAPRSSQYSLDNPPALPQLSSSSLYTDPQPNGFTPYTVFPTDFHEPLEASFMPAFVQAPTIPDHDYAVVGNQYTTGERLEVASPSSSSQSSASIYTPEISQSLIPYESPLGDNSDQLPPESHEGVGRERWTHRYEKEVFKSVDRAKLSAAQRRRVYIASLEAHVDFLHQQLEFLGLTPVPVTGLERYDGMTQKQGKMFISGLQADVNRLHAELAGIQDENARLRQNVQTKKRQNGSIPN